MKALYLIFVLIAVMLTTIPEDVTRMMDPENYKTPTITPVWTQTAIATQTATVTCTGTITPTVTRTPTSNPTAVPVDPSSLCPWLDKYRRQDAGSMLASILIPIFPAVWRRRKN